MIHRKRRYPIGAEVIDGNQTDFRVWAPKARELDVVVEDGANSKRVFHALTPEPDGLVPRPLPAPALPQAHPLPRALHVGRNRSGEPGRGQRARR